MRHCYLVDASIYIFRAYFAMPDRFFDAEGRSLNAVYGFCHFMLDLLIKTDGYYGFAFDESLMSGFRHQLYPEYKANRALPDDELANQLHWCRMLAEALGFCCYSSDEFEADDILATLRRKLKPSLEKGKVSQVVIVSRDKDLTQMLTGEDQLWDYAADAFLDRVSAKEKYGFDPIWIPDFLALAGDSVDNIPGVSGVGTKTATQLIQEFDNLDQLYENLDRVVTMKIRGAASLQQKLEREKEHAFLFRSLTRLHDQVPLSFGLQKSNWSAKQLPDFTALLEELGIARHFMKKIEQLSVG